MTNKTNDPLSPDYWVNYWTNSMRLPWSGAVHQNGWLDWDKWFSPVTNINLKGNPQMEHAIHEEVASYGTQLGILSEAVLSLAKQQGVSSPPLKRLDVLVAQIEDAKAEHREFATEKLVEALRLTRSSDPDLYESILKAVDDKHH